MIQFHGVVVPFIEKNQILVSDSLVLSSWLPSAHFSEVWGKKKALSQGRWEHTLLGLTAISLPAKGLCS